MTDRQLAAKEYMEGYEEACREVRLCEEQYERESIQIDAVRSLSDNDGMPHGSGISRPTESKAIRLVDKRRRLDRARRKAYEKGVEIFDVAFYVGGIEGEILIERYINLRGWDAIYKLVNYSESQTHRYHRTGLDKVADILNL